MAASTARRLVEMRVFIECLLWFYGIALQPGRPGAPISGGFAKSTQD
jgi:hypothetical protein